MYTKDWVNFYKVEHTLFYIFFHCTLLFFPSSRFVAMAFCLVILSCSNSCIFDSILVISHFTLVFSIPQLVHLLNVWVLLIFNNFSPSDMLVSETLPELVIFENIFVVK